VKLCVQIDLQHGQRRQQEARRSGQEGGTPGQDLEVPAKRSNLFVLPEMRSAKHMDGESSYSPLWDLYLSLKKMHDVELAAMTDPTGLGSFGAFSSESNRVDAMSKLATAITRARKAKDFDTDGDDEKAIEQLKLLFNR
jgi:hypothetical protein